MKRTVLSLVILILLNLSCASRRSSADDYLIIKEEKRFSKLMKSQFADLSIGEKNKVLWYSLCQFDEVFFRNLIELGADGEIIVQEDHFAPEPLVFWLLGKKKSDSLIFLLENNPKLLRQTRPSSFLGDKVDYPFFLWAVKNGSSELIKYIYDSDISLFNENLNGVTPYFLFLSSTNNPDVKRELLSYFTEHSDIKHIADDGSNVFRWANLSPADIDWDGWMKMAIEKGVEINKPGLFGRTALGWQCWTMANGDLEYCKYLERIIPLFIKYGANPKYIDEDGYTVADGLTYLTKNRDDYTPEELEQVKQMKRKLETMLNE